MISMVAGLVVSIDGGLKLTAMDTTSPIESIIDELKMIIKIFLNEHTPKGIEIAFRKIISFRGGGRSARRSLQLPGFKRLAQ